MAGMFIKNLIKIRWNKNEKKVMCPFLNVGRTFQ
jgi:hypothetical protein